MEGVDGARHRNVLILGQNQDKTEAPKKINLACLYIAATGAQPQAQQAERCGASRRRALLLRIRFVAAEARPASDHRHSRCFCAWSLSESEANLA